MSATALASRPVTGPFLASVIQHALDTRQITPTWLEQFSAAAQAAADRMAERETQHRSPTANEFRGAMVRLRHYLTYAVEQRSGGRLDAAVQAIASVPLKELLSEGRAQWSMIKQSLLAELDRINSDQGRLSDSGLHYTIDVEYWARSGLEDLGRTYDNEAKVDQTAYFVWFFMQEVQLGQLLNRRHPIDAIEFLTASYGQLIENMAVNLMFHDTIRLTTTLPEVQAFCHHFVLGNSPDPALSAELGRRLEEHLRSIGASDRLARWFSRSGWPAYVSEIVNLTEHPITRKRCLYNRVFFPAATARHTTTFVPSAYIEEALYRRFRNMPANIRATYFAALDDAHWQHNWILKLIGDGRSDDVVDLLGALPIKLAGAMLRLEHVQLRDICDPHPSLPDWIKEYLKQLGSRPHDRQQFITAYRNIRQPPLFPRS